MTTVSIFENIKNRTRIKEKNKREKVLKIKGF